MSNAKRAIKRSVSDLRKWLQVAAGGFFSLVGRRALNRDETSSLLPWNESESISLLEIPSPAEILKWGVVRLHRKDCLDLDYGARSSFAGWTGPVMECEKAAAVWSHKWMGYYHWIIDVAPKIALLQERYGHSLEGWKICYPGTDQHFEKEVLGLLGVPESAIVDTRRFKIIKAKRVAVCRLPGWYQIQPAAALLRSRLISYASEGFGERIYVSRAGRRRCANEDEVFTMLRARGFVFLEDRCRSVAEQIGIFKGAKVIVAPHGAALTNLLWCEPDTIVVEFFASNYQPVYYRSLSDFQSLRYQSLSAGNGEEEHWSAMVDDIEADVASLGRLLDLHEIV